MSSIEPIPEEPEIVEVLTPTLEEYLEKQRYAIDILLENKLENLLRP